MELGRLQLDHGVTCTNSYTEHKAQDMQRNLQQGVAFHLTSTKGASWSSPFLHVRLPPLIGHARAQREKGEKNERGDRKC